MERLMMTIPNFAPRGVGFRFTEAQLFITATAATPSELLTTTMRQIRCPPFRKRFNEYIESEENPMTYINEKHRARFELAAKNIPKANYALLSALYTQDTIFGGFAPNSSSAETLSKALGSRTVMSGSVSRSKNDPSQSLQMIERPLLTPDELKSLPKGDFIVMKTGVHPMRVHLKLFFKWGIEFDDEHPYAVPDQGNREVRYADKKEIQDGILEKYPPEWKEETPAPSDADGSGQAQHDSPKNEPQRTPPKDKNRGGNPIRTSPPKKETTPDITEAEIIKD